MRLLRAGVLAPTLALLACRTDRTAPADAVQPDPVHVAAESLYFASEFDTASALFDKLLTRARANGDAADEASALTWLGRVGYRTSDFPAGRARAEAAVEIGRRLRRPDLLTDAYNVVGLIALEEKRLAEAGSLFAQSAEAARAAGNESAVARAAGNTGLVSLERGDIDGARRNFGDMLLVARANAQPRMEANALANLATADIWAGHAWEAFASLDSARRIYRSIDNAPGETNALGQLATAYLELDDPAGALAALDSALALARRFSLRDEEAELLRILGGVHRSLGDLPRALRFYDEAATLDEDLELEQELGNVLRGTAAIRLVLGDVNRAGIDAERALRTHRAAGDRFDELDDLLVLAAIRQRAGRSAHASAALRSARALADALGTRSARIAVAVAEAGIADLDGDDASLVAAVGRVTGDLESGLSPREWEAYALLARAHSRAGRLEAAIAAGQRAVDRLERVRGSLGSDELETAFVADRSRVYGDLALALLRAGRVDDAFDVAERARSRALLNHLQASRADVRRGIAATDLAEADALLRKIDVLLRRLGQLERGGGRERAAGLPAVTEEIAVSLRDARARYEALVIRSARQDPAAGTLLGAHTAPVGETRASLRANEALLEYLVLEKGVLLFVARRDRIDAVMSAVDAEDLAGAVRVVRDLSGNAQGDWRAALPAARTLYDILVSPAVERGLLDGAERWIVVPHGVLASLPFAALRDPVSDRYVAEERIVTYLPLASALPVLRKRAAPRWSRVGGDVFVPFPGALPASRNEAEAFRRSVPGASIRLDARATERELRKSLASGRIVHVATHGVLNARNPLFSRIELARSRRPAPADDGRLEVHEVPGMTIDAPMVFLSGCETGVGNEWSADPANGSHQTTLAQAFLYAGAGGVISTFWRIEDEGASEFAARFYAALEHSEPVAAFATAQRAMMRDPRFASPYYWAAYTLSGVWAGGEPAPLS